MRPCERASHPHLAQSQTNHCLGLRVRSYEAEIEVPLSTDQAFRLWTDAGRYPQWQVGVTRVFDVTGPTDRVGTSLRLDFGPGMKRTTRVVESDPPRRYAVEEDGMKSRNRTTTTFVPTETGARIAVTYDLEVEMGPLSGVMERMTRGQTLKTGQKELAAFAALAGRPLVRPAPGELFTVDGYAGYRVVKVIGAGADVVHISLAPGAMRNRGDDHAEALVAEILDNESRLDDVLSLRPLEPSIRRSASMVIVGQPLFALDGGIGVPHLAMTIGAFSDGSPEPAGSAPIFPDETEEVKEWRGVTGPVLGRDLDTGIVPLVSIKDGGQYGIAKLLQVERKGVHVRLYADRFDMPPDHLNPWTLRIDRYDAPSMSYGHAPLSRAAFAAMDPAFARLAMRSADELEGYRMWQEADGGFFSDRGAGR